MKNILLLLVLTILSLCPCSAAHADVRIVVSFTEIENIVDPVAKTVYSPRTQTFILTKDHKLINQYTVSGKFSTGGAVTIGVPQYGTNLGGVKFVLRYGIENGTIVIATFFKTHKIIKRIKTDGKSECTASIDYVLLKGAKEFQDRSIQGGGLLRMSDIRAEGISCEISELPE